MKDLNVNVKRDCFGYKRGCNENGSSYCTALNKLYCETEECKFYKPRDIIDTNYVETEIKNYSM